jgi:Holliday junction resolvasome RuvABC endonuclease subunit
MITMGIRAAPKIVTFAIYDSERQTILNVEAIKIPAAFSTPDRLKYIRSNLLDVLREFKVSKAGIRAIEPSAQTQGIERIEIEGVIKEAFASSELVSYYVGHISSISARLGIERRAFKPLVDGEQEYPVENWDGMSRDEREAILCAVGAVDA